MRSSGEKGTRIGVTKRAQSVGFTPSCQYQYQIL